MTPKGDCGCGGATAGMVVDGKSGGCGGGCGGHCGCEPSLRGEAFVRPRFFSGMLLTEDDLQGIVDYDVAKRRLTNRYVLGAGVVCGLDVTCHPCEPGSVHVAPGYAIECCGNDVYVSCPEDVDVIELVRDLRQRRGIDCGEPCEDQPHQDYYLYVRYVESHTAPVAPYASDECVVGDCEFSRIREGYCFELRCEPPEEEPSWFDARMACRGRDDKTQELTKKVLALVDSAAMYARVSERAAAGPEPVPDIPTRDELDAELAREEVALPVALDLIRRSTLTLAMDAASKKGNAPSPALNTQRRNVLSSRTRELARKVLDSAELHARPLDERLPMERLLLTAEEQPDLSETTTMDRAWLAEGKDLYEVERGFVTGAGQLQAQILRSLSEQGRSRCREYRELSALRVDTLHAGSVAAAEAIGRAYVRSYTDCTCAAFHPPCPTCTDNAVLLARVRVEGCDVVDVCSHVRRWVLSPRAASYWLDVDSRFEYIARICCGDRRKPTTIREERPRGEVEVGEPVGVVEAATVPPAMAYDISPLTAAGVQPEMPSELVELAGAVGLSLTEPVVARPFMQPAEAMIRTLEGKVGELERRLAELSPRTDEGEEVET